jgi:hypothetical protein
MSRWSGGCGGASASACGSLGADPEGGADLCPGRAGRHGLSDGDLAPILEACEFFGELAHPVQGCGPCAMAST